MEIGSFYESDPVYMEKMRSVSLQEANYRETTLSEVEKYHRKNTVFTGSGRAAIAVALRSLEKEQPAVRKKCLMPAYMCDSVFFPFEQNGWELCFYHIGKNLEADREELISLIEKEQPGILFIHPYYGVDTWKELRPLLIQYRKDGLVLMEDVTQAYYLRTDFTADYIVGSLRKWYGIIDGGFVTTDRVLCREGMVYDEEFNKERERLQTMKWQYLKERQERKGFDALEKQHWVETVLPKLVMEKEEYLSLNRRLEAYLDEKAIVTKMSDLTLAMLSDVDEEECRKRRNENYRILQKGLQNKNALTPVLPTWEEAAPLYLPVYMKDRDALQKYLRERDIYVPVLWPVGKENADCLSGDEQYIYSHIAAIPMDQRYGKEEMERILEVIEEYESL